MNMEEKRKKYVINLRTGMTALKRMIAVNEKSKENLEHSSNDKTYVQTRLQQLTDNNKKYYEQILELEEKISKTQSGLLDDEVIAQYITIKNGKNKRLDPNQQDIDNYKKYESYLQSEKREYKTTRQKAKDMDYNYNHYWKAVFTLPDYIKKNLKQLPNNKGYIWKGVHFYGEKPEEKNKPMVMFEKYGNSPLIIHEWDNMYYTVYKKTENEKIMERRQKLANIFSH